MRGVRANLYSLNQQRWEYDVESYSRMLKWAYSGLSDRLALYAFKRMGEIRHRYPSLSKIFDQMDKEAEQSQHNA